MAQELNLDRQHIIINMSDGSYVGQYRSEVINRQLFAGTSRRQNMIAATYVYLELLLNVPG